MNVVISQPMFFPWVGLFEQINLADVYVHYGDVQFSKGSFTNRVQIKTAQGIKWLTVPLQNVSLGQSIDEVEVNTQINWRKQHLDILRVAYAKAPHCEEMLSIVAQVYGHTTHSIGELAKLSMTACCDYFGLETKQRFIEVQQLKISGSSSQRVLEIVQRLDGTKYITGLGARNYLDHSLFESAGIRVEYMNYLKSPYPQCNGEFTPYVSILDLIANMGKEGGNFIHSGTIYWKDYLKNE